MTDDPTTTLAAHGRVVDFGGAHALCLCGWESDPLETIDEAAATYAHAAHQLEVLADEGWAVVKLDEATDEGDGPYWDGHRHNVIVDDGLVEVDVSVVSWQEAKELAAHILAAARSAEEAEK